MLQDLRVVQRDFLLELIRLMTQELDLDTLLGRLLQLSVDMLSGNSGFIALSNPSTNWTVRTIYGLTSPMVKYIETYLEHFPIAEKGEDQRPIEINLLIERIRQHPDFNVTDGLGLPLVHGGTLLGIVVVFRSVLSRFSQNDMLLLRAYAGQASIAVRNAALYTENLRAKQQTDAILDALSDGVLVMDSRGVVTRVNPALTRLFGADGSALIGLTHDEVIRFSGSVTGMTLAEGIAGGWPFTGRSQLSVEGDLILRDEALRTIPVSISYLPILTDSNQLLNMIASVQDISKFREADALKNTFISTVSHELKTPVALIKGYASTMRMMERTSDSGLISETLQVIEDESDRLTELINDLLDASRMMAGSLKLHRITFNLCDLCERIAARQQTQTARHRIVTDFPSDFPLVTADPDRIEQVLKNLLTNAVKYTDGGTITIRGTSSAEEVRIDVIDEGRGLKVRDLPFLFDKFYRSKETATLAKGVGLGLFISRAIIAGHGGKLSAQNRDDRDGAVFSFTLPLSADMGLDYFSFPGQPSQS